MEQKSVEYIGLQEYLLAGLKMQYHSKNYFSFFLLYFTSRASDKA